MITGNVVLKYELGQILHADCMDIMADIPDSEIREIERQRRLEEIMEK